MKSLQEIWDKIEILEAQNAGDTAAERGDTATAELAAAAACSRLPDGVRRGPGRRGTRRTRCTAAMCPGIGAVDVRLPDRQIRGDQRTVRGVPQRGGGGRIPTTLYDTRAWAAMCVAGSRVFGAPGSYGYGAKAAMGDKPVNYVSWYDAVRFCNWLHNGRPTGVQDATTTEGGTYTLTGERSIAAGTDPTHGANGRNTGAKFWLPSENEWYKAAYHQPAGQGGDADNYWLYPTQSNAAPTVAIADVTGNISNDNGNIANYELWSGLERTERECDDSGERRTRQRQLLRCLRHGRQRV